MQLYLSCPPPGGQKAAVEAAFCAEVAEELQKSLKEKTFFFGKYKNILKKVLIVGVVGVMIGIFIIFLIEFLDNKVKTPQDMEKYFNIPVLGVIPNENK